MMRDEHQARIGALIARLREQQGWSQRALAKWVGIDQSAVSRIEAGHRRLSADELQRFAQALHVSADDLLRDRREPPAVATPSGADLAAVSMPALETRSDWPVAGRRSSSDRGAQADVAAALREGSTGDAGETRPRAAALEAMLSSRRFAQAEPRAFESARADDAAAAPDETIHGLAGADLRSAGSAPLPPRLAGLPPEVAGVAGDWFRLRSLAEAEESAAPWRTGHSALGTQERVSAMAPPLPADTPAGDVLYDRVARFWRSELHVAPDDGALPDIVPLLEDGYGAQVVVARVPSGDRPVAATFTAGGVPFLFVNAARPVLLQRFALAHAFAHLVLGHGDVVDRRIEWNRNAPPEAAANDFAEELLAPVRAVLRWYERRPSAHRVRTEDLLDLGNAFGISAWAALYRSRAAGRLHGKQFQVVRGELERHEWELLPRQAYLGGLRDTLAHLTPDEVLPQGLYGEPAVLRVPAAMRAWALTGLRRGRLSLEEGAAALHIGSVELAESLARLGLD